MEFTMQMVVVMIIILLCGIILIGILMTSGNNTKNALQGLFDNPIGLPGKTK